MRMIDICDRVGVLVADVLTGLSYLAEKGVVVHSVVTSPPYLDARDYGVPPTAWPEVTYRPRFDLEPVTVPAMTCCLGHEPSLLAYVGHMVLVVRAIAQVLREDGTLWMNIGAGYSSGTTARRKPTTTEGPHVPSSWKGRCYEARVTGGLPAKQRIPVPSAVRDAVQADGWYVRNDIAWTKSNAKPDSATDRCTPAHENVLLFARRPSYFFDAVAISTPARFGASRNARRAYGAAHSDAGDHHGASVPLAGDIAHPRDVWAIPVGRFKHAHFATFPPELARRCIAAGTSAVGCCPTCSAPWLPIIAQADAVSTGGGRRKHADHYAGQGETGALATGVHHTRAVVGWRLPCKCPLARPMPAMVLDPFGGSGTTGAVANALGRRALLVDAQPDYVPMMASRVTEITPASLAPQRDGSNTSTKRRKQTSPPEQLTFPKN